MDATPSPVQPPQEAALEVVRHLAATLAYRAAKVLRDTPPGFAETTSGSGGRRAVQIVAHMADLMTWGVSLAQGGFIWNAGGSDDWNTEVEADALTHVGQLAMLRGLAGAPVRPESYARAEIVPGRVGWEQSPPVKEFDGDASARR
jgi:hypothetical protein